MALALLASLAWGQEAVEEAELVLELEIDDALCARRGYLGLLEPDIGVSSDTTRINPVNMVATLNFVYVLDAMGNIEERIPLRREVVGPEAWTDLQHVYVNDKASSAANGEVYLIITVMTRGTVRGYANLRVFDRATQNLLFELNRNTLPPGRTLGRPHLSPKGDCLLLLHDNVTTDDGIPAFLDFYDMEGILRRHVDFTESGFDPVQLGFSEDGRKVIVSGFKSDTRIVYDMAGNELARMKSDTVGLANEARSRDLLRVSVLRSVLGAGPLPQPLAVQHILLNRAMNVGVLRHGRGLYVFRLGAP